MNREQPAAKRGRVKYVLVHHDGCGRGGFHFRVAADGTSSGLLDETARGQHAHSLGVVVTGRFDERAPSEQQITGLKNLLLDLKCRYPDAVVGAHRQVRGDAESSCPGRLFPMQNVVEWSRSELIRLRDERLRLDVEAQYQPR